LEFAAGRPIERTSRRSIRAGNPAFFTSAHLTRTGAAKLHCRYASRAARLVF
jgi:hypothetical protein